MQVIDARRHLHPLSIEPGTGANPIAALTAACPVPSADTLRYACQMPMVYCRGEVSVRVSTWGIRGPDARARHPWRLQRNGASRDGPHARSLFAWRSAHDPAR